MCSNKQLVQEQIANWIRRNLLRAFPDRERCRRIVVRHLDLDRQPQEWASEFPVPAGEGFAGEIDFLIDAIVEAVQHHVSGCDFPIQLYALYACRNKGRYVPHRVFRAAREVE